MTEPKRPEALVFDAYGTLFDVHSVANECERLFPGRGAALAGLWRSKQLEYSWLRSLMGRYVDFESITHDALVAASRSLGLELSDSGRRILVEAYRQLKPFPEAVDALINLKGRKLAILSNGSPEMLKAVVRNSGFDSLLDAVISVDELRIFKPHPSVYALAVDRLGVPADCIGFVSSNYWDIAGAASFGFRTFWINRAASVPDELGGRPAVVLSSLDELVQLVG